ncbi:MAG TPA: DNA polymerase III subunit delta [Clostridiales bacterium]|nr:DNA polymerase III subunit delta [Clostridiales bacterium]
MAKKNEKLNYPALIRELAETGPARIYILSGPEDYLRELFLKEIKKLCLTGGEDDFNYHRMDGPSLDMSAFADALDVLPFAAPRTLIEIRGFDVNRCRDAEADRLNAILADVPDYATVVFVQNADYEVDWRLKAAKSIKKHGQAVNFASQDQKQLLPWIRRRFLALGKTIAPDAAMQLIYMSGELMSGLIPEIEKIALSVEADTITADDVARYAHSIPEARVFDMTDCLAAKDYDGAARLLAELTASGEEPVKTVAIIGGQMRRLYAARLAIEEKLGSAYVGEVCGIGYEFIIKKLMAAARGFTLPQLQRAVRLCAETDYAMKSSSAGDSELLKDLFVKLAVGETE